MSLNKKQKIDSIRNPDTFMAIHESGIGKNIQDLAERFPPEQILKVYPETFIHPKKRPDIPSKTLGILVCVEGVEFGREDSHLKPNDAIKEYTNFLDWGVETLSEDGTFITPIPNYGFQISLWKEELRKIKNYYEGIGYNVWIQNIDNDRKGSNVILITRRELPNN